MMDFYLKSLAFVTGFFLIAVWLKELLSMAAELVLAPHFGQRVKMLSFFGLRFECGDDGRWEKKPFRYSQLIQTLVVPDLRHGVPENLERREKRFLLLRCSVLLLISTLLLILTRGSILALFERRAGYPDVFLAGLSLGLAFHSLYTLGIYIYVYAVMMKRLGGYTQHLLRRIRQGEPISQMELVPVDALPYKKAGKTERMLYYNIYLLWLLLRGDTAGMKAPIREMTDYYRSREYIPQDTLGYYWLIFYYARYDLNPSAAAFFYDKVRQVITADPDANAKRVLAYYAFGIERNPGKAQQLVTEGLACVDSFSQPGEEREAERRLLLELQGFLDRASGQGGTA